MKAGLLNGVENIVVKLDIAYFKQYLLLPQYFQNPSSVGTNVTCICMWESVLQFIFNPPNYSECLFWRRVKTVSFSYLES